MSTPSHPTASYDDPTLLPRQRDRWPIAVQRAEAKAQALRAQGANFRDVGPLVQAACNSGKLRQRVVWMHRAASAWSKVFAPVAACRKGCGHCCRQPVSITGTEAQLLAEASGRAIARNPRVVSSRVALSDEQLAAEIARAKEVGKASPCPFLVDEQCSVYEARPLACRALLNMDDDNLLCQHSVDGPCDVPFANGRWLTDQALALQPGFVVADIRSFFPPVPDPHA